MEKDNKRKCDVCEIPHFERNNYFYGKLMTARDFTDEQCYFNEKRWLINRMIHGWGVVCGLDVKFEDGKEECIQEISSCQKEKQCNIVIDQGLAIDCFGREILVCDKQIISLADVEPPCNPATEHSKRGEKKYVICLEYNECKTESVTIVPSVCSQSEKTDYNRIRDSFKIRLRHASDVCIQDYQREFCQLADRHKTEQGQYEKKHDYDAQQGCGEYETLHGYLCDKLREGCPDCDPCGCLVLAEITVEHLNSSESDPHQDPKQQERQEKPQNPQIKISIDPCSRRRLVYNNKLLYDLIHCYHDDLPHIINFSWKDYHGKGVHWYLSEEGELKYKGEGVLWDQFVKIIDEGFIVEFDRGIEPTSMNSFTILISYKFFEKSTATFIRRFIPLGDIQSRNNQCQYVIKIYDKFIKDEIIDSSSKLTDGVDVEIIIRSGFIHDNKGKALDGDFIASKLPTGNGVQGGDFVSWFSVMPKKIKKIDESSANLVDIYPETM